MVRLLEVDNPNALAQTFTIYVNGTAAANLVGHYQITGNTANGQSPQRIFNPGDVIYVTGSVAMNVTLYGVLLFGAPS